MSEAILDDEGLELKLGGQPSIGSAGRGPRCCAEARFILNHKGDGPFSDNPGKYSCVCEGRSYCPEHGIRCNGTHD